MCAFAVECVSECCGLIECGAEVCNPFSLACVEACAGVADPCVFAAECAVPIGVVAEKFASVDLCTKLVGKFSAFCSIKFACNCE